MTLHTKRPVAEPPFGGCPTYPGRGSSRFWLQPFDLEYYRLDPVRTAGDEIVGVLHPGAKVSIGHECENDFMDIIPGPFTWEAIRTAGNKFHIEFLAFFE